MSPKTAILLLAWRLLCIASAAASDSDHYKPQLGLPPSADPSSSDHYEPQLWLPPSADQDDSLSVTETLQAWFPTTDGDEYMAIYKPTSWSEYYDRYVSSENADVGLHLNTWNVKTVSNALHTMGVRGDVWAASYNHESFNCSKRLRCLSLNVDTGYVRVGVNDECGEGRKKFPVRTVKIGRGNVESLVVDGKKYFFLDQGIPWHDYEEITTIKHLPVIPADLTSANIHKISNWLGSIKFSCGVPKGSSVWIGSWNGDSYSSEKGDGPCLTLTFPYAVSAHTQPQECRRLNGALFTVVDG
ncbi:hypothetical protein HDU67_000427 [Dinochytrium kinnereticum]|nr:hypothetical protein HDU67_000427 [Dinochytrium kinnereticum]